MDWDEVNEVLTSLIVATRGTFAILMELCEIVEESQEEAEYAGCETRCCDYCPYGI